uniref:Small ribosomal subunit protein uS8c n=1 Tax=Caulerpa cliftonii TaxID=1004391 RepID=A0A1C9JBM2_9CHLO|nr:ribosomal protein S8 [Caulerpa cliftonii]AOP19244.1 ribosomal protein S8 [Caulerpa cliftonii]
MKDSISDLFTRIRNACLVRHNSVDVPYTKINIQIIKLLLRQGFIDNFQNNTKARSHQKSFKDGRARTPQRGQAHSPKRALTPQKQHKQGTAYLGGGCSWITLSLKYKKDHPLITQIGRLSRPGCRVYVHCEQIPQICGQLGIILMSTSRGIVSDREARQFGIGGELLGFIS